MKLTRHFIRFIALHLVCVAMRAESFRSPFQQRRLRKRASGLCTALLLLNSSCSSKTTPQSQQSAGSPQPALSPANQQTANASADQPPAKIPAEQLDSLVAPIALYPDPLLSQVLVASTYPLEIIQLQQWLEKNKARFLATHVRSTESSDRSIHPNRAEPRLSAVD